MRPSTSLPFLETYLSGILAVLKADEVWSSCCLPRHPCSHQKRLEMLILGTMMMDHWRRIKDLLGDLTA
jgi:hypothetical protein